MTPIPTRGTSAAAAYGAQAKEGNELISTLLEAFQTRTPKELLRYFAREDGGPVWVFGMYTDGDTDERMLVLPAYDQWQFDDTWANIAIRRELARVTVRYPYLDPPEVTVVIYDRALHEDVFTGLGKLAAMHKLRGGERDPEL